MMAYFIVRQSGKKEKAIPPECHSDLLFVIQDAISYAMDLPMAKVSFNHEISTKVLPTGIVLEVTVSATSNAWDRIYDSKRLVKESVKKAITGKLGGRINESQILVMVRSSIDPNLFRY